MEKLGANCLFLDGGIEITDEILNSRGLTNWDAFEAPYQLMKGLEITSSTGLILEEGARLQFHADQRLTVLTGSFVEAVGTEDKPVIIEGLETRSGYWKGVVVANTGQVESAFSHAIIQHTGSSPLAGSQAVSVQLLTDGRISMDHTLVRFGAGDGIEATSDGARIFHFAENTISDHAGHPVVVSTENVEVLDFNTRFGNTGKPAVRVDGNKPIARDEETVWKGFQQGIPYRIKGLSNDLMVWSGLKLTEGVIIKFEDGSAMHVEEANGRTGYLKIEGTGSKNVIIRGTSEIPGSWYGITISSLSPDNHISFAQVLHGGKRQENNLSAVITLDNAPEGRLTIQNSVVGYSGQHGISVVNTRRANLAEAQISFIGIPESLVYARYLLFYPSGIYFPTSVRIKSGYDRKSKS